MDSREGPSVGVGVIHRILPPHALSLGLERDPFIEHFLCSWPCTGPWGHKDECDMVSAFQEFMLTVETDMKPDNYKKKCSSKISMR